MTQSMSFQRQIDSNEFSMKGAKVELLDVEDISSEEYFTDHEDRQTLEEISSEENFSADQNQISHLQSREPPRVQNTATSRQSDTKPQSQVLCRNEANLQPQDESSSSEEDEPENTGNRVANPSVPTFPVQSSSREVIPRTSAAEDQRYWRKTSTPLTRPATNDNRPTVQSRSLPDVVVTSQLSLAVKREKASPAKRISVAKIPNAFKDSTNIHSRSFASQVSNIINLCTLRLFSKTVLQLKKNINLFGTIAM